MARGSKREEPEFAMLRVVMAELARSGAPSVTRSAARSSTSVRTLQRRLAAEDANHRAILGAARFEVACLLLRSTDLPVQAIAGILGYSAPSGFSRAFRRWAGMTPRAYRASGD